MRKIILTDRPWRAYRALWLLMAMALVVDLCSVVVESELLQDAAATPQMVETSDWLSFSSEAVGLLSLSGLLILLRGGRGVRKTFRRACLVEGAMLLAYLVASKVTVLVFGPLSVDDGHWVADSLNFCADILLLVFPAGLLAVFLLCAPLGGRVGRLSVVAAVAMGLVVPVGIGFVVNAIQEQPDECIGLVLGVLLGVLCLVPVAVLRMVAGGGGEA